MTGRPERRTAACEHPAMPGPVLATRPATQRQVGARTLAPIPNRTPPQHGAPQHGRAGIIELQRTAGNRAVAAAIAAVQREEKDPKAASAGPDVVSGADKAAPKRTTGFLGLNPGADIEAAKLRKTTKDNVLTSLNDPVAEAKLKNDPAVADFVFDELGISVGDFNRWDKATDVLLKGNVHLREQLADLMRWFNRAEKGEIILDRLVLSGHSNGVELWGESEPGAESKPGLMLLERDLAGIGDVFPKARDQVEDIMFSACFSISAVEIVVKVFPNLKNAWTYTSFSPSIKQGSADHVAAFANATEGAGGLKKSDRRGSTALWTKEKGYIVGDPGLAAAGPLYSNAIRKWREIAGPMYDGSGPDLTSEQLMPAYAAAQQMIAHPGTPADRRDNGKKVMQILLRLRFWPLVRTRFGADYKSTLQPAYDALGMSQPEWASMTRKQVKAHVDTVVKAVEDKAAAKAYKDLLERYLTNGIFLLKDEKVIKTDWI
jgi:hypothetical protein